jgi:hypothetical protein
MVRSGQRSIAACQPYFSMMAFAVAGKGTADSQSCSSATFQASSRKVHMPLPRGWLSGKNNLSFARPCESTLRMSQEINRAKHPCDRLVFDAIDAFERIARGEPANCAGSVTAALLGYGLIRPTVRVIAKDSLGPVFRRGHSVAPDVELEWLSFKGFS